MALSVSAADLQLYLAQDDTGWDAARAELLIQLAMDKCAAIISPLPDEAKGVVLDVAARAYTNPGMVQQQAIGPVQVAYGAQTGGLWLTKANIADLMRLSRRTSAFSPSMLPADYALPPQPWWDNGSGYRGWWF